VCVASPMNTKIIHRYCQLLANDQLEPQDCERGIWRLTDQTPGP
jgi:hypothetical protein